MFEIKATAIELLDNSTYPEIVSIEFFDYYGCRHRFVEKWPVVSAHKFDSSFPKDCGIACVVTEEKEMSFIVDTSKPWDSESEEGVTVFEISKNLLLTSI